jgi:hypothetical protein
MARTHNDFFQREMDRDLLYFPNHQGELCSPKKIFRIRDEYECKYKDCFNAEKVIM